MCNREVFTERRRLRSLSSDLPTHPFFRSLSAIYPDAKFILATRIVEAWRG